MLYDRFENRTVITGELVAVDPIHIGASGTESLNPSDLDDHVLKDSAGNPIIPGSSVKGVVRSRFEAVMRSIGENVCDIFNNSPENCVSDRYNRKIMDDGHLSDIEKAEILYDKSCTVCKLFGGKAIAGKLRFKDCTYIGDKCAYDRRDGVGIDRDTGAAKKGVKYDFEIVPKGTRFDFVLIAENLDAQQLIYLDFIVELLQGNGLTEGDYLAFGGKTTRGLGRMKLENTKIERIDAASLKAQLAQRFSLEG